MPIERDSVLRYFRAREGSGRGRMWHDLTYQLMRVIVHRRAFGSLEQLRAFCEDPDNLCPWLPNEADRIIFSAALADGLCDMITNLGSADGVCLRSEAG